VPAVSGTTVAVEMRGERLRFFVDGVRARTIVDPALRRANRAGPVITASDGVTGARWSDFHAAAGPAATLVEGFGRGPRLRTADTGQRWATPLSEWGVRDDQAFVDRPAARGATVALVDVGAGDGLLRVTASATEPGIGVAFRCRGPRNCWRVDAVPELGTWNVVKVQRGVEQVRTNLGTVPVDGGTTVAVEMRGERLRFYVDGVLARTIVDATFRSAHRAGLSIAPGPTVTAARWRDFRFGPSFWNAATGAAR
jgi:hypothetical protein